MRSAGAILPFVLALAGCSGSEQVASLVVQPGKYSAYNCQQLSSRGREITQRERELKDLMSRASQKAGGDLVSAIAYRSDYAVVRGELKELDQTAAEKNCPITWRAESDRSIW
jgi:hypothetical protein